MAVPGQLLFDDEREETSQLLGSREDLAGKDAFELGADDSIRQFASRSGSFVNLRGQQARRPNGPECRGCS